MEKKLYMMESFVTYVNKGYITIDTDMFPEFEGKTNEQIQEMINSKDYRVDADLNMLVPAKPTDALIEKAGYQDENGVGYYNIEDTMDLWDYHNESDVDFDKIKNEESYLIVGDY